MQRNFARQWLGELTPVEDLAASVAGIRSPGTAILALEMSRYMRIRRWLPRVVRRPALSRQVLLKSIDTQIADIVGNRPKSGLSVPVAQWTQDTRKPIAASPGLRPRAVGMAERFAPARYRESRQRDASHLPPPQGEGLGKSRTWP